MQKAIIFAIFLGVVVAGATAQSYFEEEIAAWHFHTYFFEVNPDRTAEALEFRKGLRKQINNGRFEECSLNRIVLNWLGPHPISQWEMCCNKTSYNAAHSFHVQNHGNLSVLIHPLTIYDQEDHKSRAAWIGKPVVLDEESPGLYPVLPRPRPCPIYPEYPDELPESSNVQNAPLPIPGTEDYNGLNKNFNILTDPY